MADLDVVTTLWSGFPGGPGTTTMFMLTGMDHHLEELHDFFGLLLHTFPPSVILQVQNSGGTIDPTDGHLTGGWVGDAQAPMTGSGSGTYAAGVGACVRWETGEVVDGHHVRGHTYLIPMMSGYFDTNGSMSDDAHTLIQGSVNSFQSNYADELCVWHRPRAVSTRHPVARAGSEHVVTAGLLLDQVSVLRSRRR